MRQEAEATSDQMGSIVTAMCESLIQMLKIDPGLTSELDFEANGVPLRMTIERRGD